jgi:hypothetical protein
MGKLTMMRLSRWASFLAFVVVLAACERPPAGAGNAWVVWYYHRTFVPGGTPREFWAVAGAEETKAACQEMAKRWADATSAGREEWERERGTTIDGAETLRYTVDSAQLYDSWRCLPAGTDPRPR